MKVALVHDYLVQYGGAERVFEVFTEMFPQAHVYTLVHDPENMYGAFANTNVHTSFLQRIPFAKKHHRFFPPLMPMAAEDLDLSQYDLVISSSSSYAKGVLTGPNTLHICYCHTPMRYAWDDCHRYFSEFQYNKIVKALLPLAMNYIRMWDRLSADRVDVYVANSHNVKRRIRKYYQLDSEVVHPAVNVDRFKVLPDPQGDYYLALGRLLPYKHYDILIEAFRENGKQLRIVGAGPEEQRLKELAGDAHNIQFLGRLPDDEAQAMFMNCKAFLFPSEDDFGIVPVEAMSAGRPVIAFGRGGALETVVEGVTGTFFTEQTKESVKEAVDRFETQTYDAQTIRVHAEKFAKDRFIQEMQAIIDRELSSFMTTNQK